MEDARTTMEEVEAMNEEVSMIDLVRAVEAMARIFYEREHVKKEGPIYSYDELREVFQANKDLENFFDQLYSLDRPLEHTEQTMSGTSNEGLDTMAILGVSTISRAVGKRQKKASDAHKEYVENAFSKFFGKAFVLNIDDYHNIHVPQQSDSTLTSRPAHMATIIANLCPISAILRNRALNPKFSIIC
ncbi:hypothetical protein C2G38_2031825 [Gigaspora rosea]|uniref:Uncharacterized protein n=1 Tax=Gigaspora rosea TaxID=44941 RepID=A0A397VU27_9GLOM|nr:hypothetical protein C2G38_2031825 [Gigaspora rosea]